MITLILRPVPNLDQPLDQFTVDLLDGSYAVISLVSDGTWAVVEHRKSQPSIDRGLFGSPRDAIEVLRVEVTARIVPLKQ